MIILIENRKPILRNAPLTPGTPTRKRCAAERNVHVTQGIKVEQTDKYLITGTRLRNSVLFHLVIVIIPT